MGFEIQNGLVLLDKGKESGFCVEQKSLYINDGLIVGIDEAPAGFIAETTIDAHDRLIIPGLINAHTHSYMSPMRNVADDLPFFDWLFGGVQPIEDRMEPNDAYWASLLSQAEMIRTGTTCFNDMQMHINQTARAVSETGMRAIICRGLVGNEYNLDDSRLAEALCERKDWRDCNRLSFLLGPHAPYSCGPDYLRMLAEVAQKSQMGIHIHVAESQAETENIQEKYGCSPVEYIDSTGIFDVPCIAAHCIRVSPSDCRLLAKKHVSVVSNPASNMKLGNGFAPVPELMAAGVNVCLGTDGPASNNAQNMFREMGLFALIHKGTHNSSTCVTAADTLRAATSNGARALRLNCGEISVGRKADLALLRLDLPSMIPATNLPAALAYSANGSEVESVMIDGKFVMDHGELLTIDEERVRAEITRICHRLNL